MVFVFDLDDTLYSEFDFLKSGINAVYKLLFEFGAKSSDLPSLSEVYLKKDWLTYILSFNKTAAQIGKKTLLDTYRYHDPIIDMYPDASLFLNQLSELKVDTALITDGRSRSQRNKLKALGLSDFFKVLIISEEFGSEKPTAANFLAIHEYFNQKEYVFFGDNPQKDFITPNKLGWNTVGLIDRGVNIHPQRMELDKPYQPNTWIHRFDEFKLKLS